MFQKLVIVFTQITTKYIVVVSIICWSELVEIEIAIYKQFDYYTSLIIIIFVINIAHFTDDIYLYSIHLLQPSL